MGVVTPLVCNVVHRHLPVVHMMCADFGANSTLCYYCPSVVSQGHIVYLYATCLVCRDYISPSTTSFGAYVFRFLCTEDVPDMLWWSHEIRILACRSAIALRYPCTHLE